jgi:phage terminase large subunit GpA-like protein
VSALRKELKQVARLALKPRPRISLRQWADQYRYLSRESSEASGRWRTSTVPYMAEPMEEVSSHKNKEIVLMLSSQLGKTEFILNVIGYYTDLEPSPMLVIQPTDGFASSFSKERIAPMIRDTPVLNRIFKSGYGDADDTILFKKFTGGFLALAGANSPTALAGRPIRIILLDEVDRFPISAKQEGDPVNIVRRRSQNFHDSKVIAVSTPTQTDASKIDSLYQDSDQRKWHIKCIHCGDDFYPEWSHVKWTVPEDAGLACPLCGGLHTSHERLVASKNGRWVAYNPGHRTPGFHTNALVSPWVTLTDMVHEFVACENLPNKLQPFYNTILGLPYKFIGEVMGDISIAQRIEKYTPLTLPNEIMYITVGADVQKNRIEAEVLGHTENGGTYNVDYIVFECDTRKPAAFEMFRDHLFSQVFRRVDGVVLDISVTFIDSGDNTKMVYQFTDKNRKNKIYAIKGIGGPSSMLTLSKSDYGSSFYRVGVDIFKEMVFNDLQIADPLHPKFCHFPESRSHDYFTQLCESETRSSKTDAKTGKQHYFYRKKTTNTRNEALDCRVYALAAFELIRTRVRRDALYRIKKQKEDIDSNGDAIAKIEVVPKNQSILQGLHKFAGLPEENTPQPAEKITSTPEENAIVVKPAKRNPYASWK